MAESAVSLLLSKLSAWIQQERQLLGELGNEVEFIRDELRHMKAFLRVADAKEENDVQLQEWIVQVRETTYHAEDVLDTYMLQFARHQVDDFLGYMKRAYASKISLRTRRRIAREIQKIKLRVKNISEAQHRYRDRYGFVDQVSNSVPTDDVWYSGQGDALLLEEAELVGIEKPKKQLVEWLLSYDSGLRVTSVVGMGGLGKTTLVKKVYNDAQLKVCFDHHIWLTVSESFKVEELLRSMIKKLVKEVKQPLPDGLEAMSVEEKKEFIYKFLVNKSYIIVLDDVWKVNVWDAVKYAFPRNNNYGCIVITTRLNNIGHAASMESNGNVYNLELLTEEYSQELFYKKAFRGSTCPPFLKELAASILKKCGGLPLAIVVIGNLLSTKKNKVDEWEMFNRSIGDELEGDNLKRVMKLLSLSYYDLPCHLKSCFLYLSVFPEDYLIEATVLQRLWTAEGFVEPKEGKTMEEVARGYVNELANRSLIQVIERFPNERPKKLKVHDLVKQVVLSKSRHQTSLAIYSAGRMMWPDKMRRLAVHCSLNTIQESNNFKPDFDHLRSLLFLGSSDSHAEGTLDLVLDGNCRLMKVLHLDGLPLNSIPNKVFKLYYLTYLSLKSTEIKTIPSSIGNLCNLQTLCLEDTMVNKLPIEILRLQQLRRLTFFKAHGNIEGYPPFDSIKGFKAPYEIGGMSCLQSLFDIEADHFGDKKIVVEIGKLTQLRNLGIRKVREGDGKDLCTSLDKLVHLRSLVLCSSEEHEFLDLQYCLSSSLQLLQVLLLEGRLSKVPKCIPSLHGLTTVHLGWSRLKEDPLKSLEHLPNLVKLHLYHAYDGEGLCFRAGKFQKLKKLEFLQLRFLKWLTVEESSMPDLEELIIWRCKLLEELPSGIEHLTKLNYINLNDMSQNFVSKLQKQKKEEGESWKLVHVPRIDIFRWQNGEWKGWRLQKPERRS